MGVKVKGLEATISGVNRRARNGSRNAEKELQRQAKLLAREARDLAPRKEGFLESAQAIRAEKPERLGIMFRVKVTAGGAPVSLRGKTRNIDEYLEIVHNNPNLNLGPGSEQKAASSGKPVGSFYVTRAVERMEKRMIAAVRDAVLRGIR